MDRELAPTLPTADDSEHIGATFGRFVPLGVLGRGGMGVVLRAKDPELDRDVAIKVLTHTSSDAGVRLQREAQAMAKLSHPNVVTVYEIGQVGDGRFLAMELVEGSTLRQWLETKRPWREVLAAFIACGRGLAAAHAAGLVHRDFKPENVLIGADGRPRVSDFGLAGLVDNAIAGTPAYMSPEQWLGEDTDARTDVFAFCVALWDALYGARPFGEGGDGRTNDELKARVLEGKIRDVDLDDDDIDTAIEPLLRRGLARKREDRWPSINALLAELDRKQVRRWPWIAGGVVAAGAIAGGVAFAMSGSPADPCPDPEPQLAAIWDSGVEAKLRAAFKTAAPALADDTAERVVAKLNGYTKHWREAGIAACRATNIDGTQSADLLDRRVQCLDRRKSELAALTGSLVAATDRARVAGAVDAAARLGDINQCSNTEQLLAASPLPTDPTLRQKIVELDREIDANQLSEGAVSSAARQANAAALVERARALDFLPVLVRALEEARDSANDNSDQQATEKVLRELAQRSAEAHEDGRSARAWIDLIRLLCESRRVPEAKALEPVVEAAVTRAGRLAQLVYAQYSVIGLRKMYELDLVGSIAAYEAAVKAADTDDRRAPMQLSLSQVIYMKDGPKAALPLAQAAFDYYVLAFGKNHPTTTKAKHMIAQYMMEGRDLARAAAIETEVIAAREAVFGKNHREVAISWHVLGVIEKGRRRYPEARKAFERAVEILEADRGTVDAGLSRGSLASVIADTEGLAAAQPIYDRALQDLATAGTNQMQYIATETDYAYRLLDANKCTEAIPHLEHVIKELPEKRVRQLPQVLEASAHCDVLAAKPDLALTKLERASKLCSEVECPPDVMPMIDFKLGRLLIDRGTDPARGRKLVDKAKTSATADGNTDLLSDIDHWEKLRQR